MSSVKILTTSYQRKSWLGLSRERARISQISAQLQLFPILDFQVFTFTAEFGSQRSIERRTTNDTNVHRNTKY
eukprot:210690-Amphidinium_carterae.1